MNHNTMDVLENCLSLMEDAMRFKPMEHRDWNYLLQLYGQGLTREDIMQKLFPQFLQFIPIHVRPGFNIFQSTGEEQALSRQTGRFLAHTKIHINNNIFESRPRFLQSQRERYFAKLNERPVSNDIAVVDKCVAILAEQIHISKTLDERETHLKVLKNLAASDSVFAKVVFAVKTGVTCLMKNDVENLNHWFSRARQLVENSGDACSVASIYLSYGEVHRCLEQFEQEPSLERKNELMEFVRQGLAKLQNVCTAEKMLWSRIFLMQKLLCQLGLGNKMNVIQRLPRELIDLNGSKETRRELGNTPGDQDTRVETFFNVALARYYELDASHDKAIACAKRAVLFSENGAFIPGELENIIQQEARSLSRAESAHIITQEADEDFCRGN